MGASNHAIELFCIRCGCVLGFLYFNTLILWSIVRINGQTIIYVVVILRICNSLIVNSVLLCGLRVRSLSR